MSGILVHVDVSRMPRRSTVISTRASTSTASPASTIASPESSYATGAEFRVDGGMTSL